MDDKDLEELVKKMTETADKVALLAERIGSVTSGLDKAASTVETIRKATEEWHVSMGGIAEVLGQQVTRITAISELSQELAVVGEVYGNLESIAKETEKIEDSMADQVDLSASLYDQLKQRYDIAVKQLEVTNTEGVRNKRTLDETFSGLTNIKGTLSSMMSVAPMGSAGLISLIFWGLGREHEYMAQGSKVAHIFDIVKGGAGDLSGYMTAKIEKFKAEMNATSQDLAAVNHAFADVGITADTVWDRAGGDRDFVKRLGLKQENIGEASLAMDKLMSAASGSFSKMVAAGVADMGNEIHEVTSSLIEVGAAAERANQNMSQFMHTVIDNASQLKLYNVHLKSVAEGQLELVKIYQAQGMGKEFAGTLAGAQMGAITGGVQGLSQGMKAYLGAEMTPGLQQLAAGKQGTDADREMLANLSQSPLGAMIQFQQGFRDLSENMRPAVFGEMLKSIMQTANLAGEDPYEQQYLLQGLGFSQEAAAGIVKLIPKIDEAGNIGKYTPEQLDKLSKIMETESSKTSAVERLLSRIEVGITQVVTGLLGMIVQGIRGIIQSVMRITDPFNPDLKAAQEETSKKFDLQWNRFVDGIKNVAKTVPDIGRVIGMDEHVYDIAHPSVAYTENKQQAIEREKELRAKINKIIEASNVQGTFGGYLPYDLQQTRDAAFKFLSDITTTGEEVTEGLQKREDAHQAGIKAVADFMRRHGLAGGRQDWQPNFVFEHSPDMVGTTRVGVELVWRTDPNDPRGSSGVAANENH